MSSLSLINLLVVLLILHWLPLFSVLCTSLIWYCSLIIKSDLTVFQLQASQHHLFGPSEPFYRASYSIDLLLGPF